MGALSRFRNRKAVEDGSPAAAADRVDDEKYADGNEAPRNYSISSTMGANAKVPGVTARTIAMAALVAMGGFIFGYGESIGIERRHFMPFEGRKIDHVIVFAFILSIFRS